MTHAVLGPSSADRWINCPGSVALSQGIADRNSDAADEGTAYHFLASTCLTNGKNAKDYVGSVIEVRLDDTVAFVANRNDPPFRSSYTIDTDNAAFCQRYIDYVRTVALNNILEVEVAVPISEYTDEQNAEGTSDAIVINQDQQEMSVIDLKFGRGVEVTAENNPQLMMYALGALEKYTMLYEIQTVRMVIVQPRAGDGKPQEWVLHVSDLLDFGVKVKRAATSVWAALSLYNEIMASGNQLPDVFRAWCDQYLLVTEKGCMWCRAKSRCSTVFAIIGHRDFARHHIQPFSVTRRY